MKRVKKGEKYWSILFDRLFNDDGFCVIWRCEDWENDVFSEIRFAQHNYFNTREEAEAMARKLRAVLKGADVIEMPSEEEILEKQTSSNQFCPNDGEGTLTGYENGLYNGSRIGFGCCIDWLKSKIVK